MSDYKKIHESEYGDSPFNFDVNKCKNELHINLTYPPHTDADNINNQCRYVYVNQEATRASDGVRLYYDYERDGFVVEQPRPRMKLVGDKSYESIKDWIEVGFFQSWQFDIAQDKQLEDADKQWELDKQKQLSKPD